ncbi:MAG TPA: betaine/proline/choline family ABC transporter ATP-binding protein [Candidatus Limnocylindria bacterium]|nr:betaine/proline/choline family ABC transporter ATP-binding protein [Candidatus Limnocylindria bacterium]
MTTAHDPATVSPAAPADRGPGAAAGGAVVALEHVTKRYGSAPPAVDDLSLTINAGEICVLVGPSGCGKTTTMKMINRLIEPSSGRITIDGEDVTGLAAVELRRRIGYVIQQVGLFPHMTVADNVAVVPRLLHWPAARITARVDELLELVGLDPKAYAGRYPAALSGGERQRIGVARALAADPPVMLMDEPFGAVDPIRRERLQNEFLRLQAQVRKTVVFVTHDVDEAIKMADRIAILQRGGILAQYDTPDAILAKPASEFVEHFVGADRGLKRLSLGRVRDLELAAPVLLRVGDPAAMAKERVGGSADGHALLVDDAERPLGWVDAADIGSAAAVTEEMATPGSPTLQPETTLRDALSAMLLSSVQLGVVVDGRDRVLGVISVDAISDALRAPVVAAHDGRDDGAGDGRPEASAL